MKILLAGLAASAALTVAGPAAAEYLDRADAAIDGQISQLQTQLRDGIAKRTITSAEAQPLRAKLRELTLVERDYRRSGDGFDRREKAEIEQRLRALDAEIAVADGNRRRPDERRGG